PSNDDGPDAVCGIVHGGLPGRHIAAHAIGGGAGGLVAYWRACAVVAAGGGQRRQCAGLGGELAAGAGHRALSRPALVPGITGGPGAGPRVVSPLWPLVTAVELVASGGRSADRD